MTNLNYITKDYLDEFEKLVSTSTSGSTAKRKMASLKKFFNWARSKGYITIDFYYHQPVLLPAYTPPPVVDHNRTKVINLSLYLVMLALGFTAFWNFKLIKDLQKSTKVIATKPSVEVQTEATPIGDVLGTSTTDITEGASPAAVLSDIYYNGILTLPSDSPTIAAGSGLMLTAESLLLTTAKNSDGDININPDGAGKVNFILNGDTGNQLNISNANLNTGSLVDGYVGNDSNTFNLLLLEDGSKPTTRFSVDSGGNTFVSGNINSGGKLTVDTHQSGAIANFGNGETNCSLNPSITGGLSCTSDERLKKNINALSGGLAQVLNLTPVTFQFNSQTDSNLNTGFIAQQVENVIPQAVQSDDNGYKSISYSTFIPYLVKAIQELNNKVSDNISVGTNITSHFIADGSTFVIDNIQAGAIVTTNFTTQNLTAGVANVTTLIANNVSTKTVATDLITPLTGTDVAVKVGTASESGKLAIQNSNGDEVASIDSQGNASVSGQLSVTDALINHDATISGTLYADNIVGTSPDIQKDRDQIQKLLTQVEQDESLISQSNGWKDYIASNSANFADITGSNLYITNQAAISSLSVTDFFSLSDLSIKSFNKLDGSKVVGLSTITSPLSLQYLSFAPVDFEGGKVTIDTLGNLTIQGNLNVAGTTTVNDLQSKSLETSKLVIANAADKPDNSSVSSSLIQTNATAGVATVSATLSDVEIDNPTINSSTLVYITPTSPTSNQVLYIKSKGDGFFIVGFNKPLENDVSFNWWVIDTK